VARRRAEIDRGVTLVGPHATVEAHDRRPDAHAGIAGRAATLAPRCDCQRAVVHSYQDPPVLLLDDVFSESTRRSSALVAPPLGGDRC
jgi:recombinational DNA repair ATPase RecF